MKASAYLQRWQRRKHTAIRFDVPRTKAEDPLIAQFATERKGQADVYVFALLRHPFRLFGAQLVLYIGVALILLAMVLRAHGGELPPHAVSVDQFGTWTCERGYVMRWRAGGFECVSEEEAARIPRFEVSTVPSAGDGARRSGGEDLGQGYGYGEAPAGAQAPSLVIQSNQPWTVLLDSQGNPSTVIVGGQEPPRRSGRKSRSQGDHRDHNRRPQGRPTRADVLR